MKHWQKTVLALVLTAVCVMFCSCTGPAAPPVEPATDPVTEPPVAPTDPVTEPPTAPPPSVESVPLEPGDLIIQVMDYSSSHMEDCQDFYTFRQGQLIQIPQETVEQVAPGAVMGGSEGGVTAHPPHWYVTLCYFYLPGKLSPGLDARGYRTYLPTEYGENYWLYYSKWNGTQDAPSAEVEAVIQQVVYQFHDGDTNDAIFWGSENGGPFDHIGLTSYFVVDTAEGILICHESNTLYLWNPDGTLLPLLIPDPSCQFYFHVVPDEQTP